MASTTKQHEQSNQDTGTKGQFLIATSAMQDPRFDRAVIYMVEHDSTSAMGVIINRVFEEIQFIDLLDQLDIEYTEDLTNYPVLIGGPVDIGRGFIMHTPDVVLPDTTLDRKNDFAVTTSIDMLSRIANGKGPKKSVFALGYSGWGPGQLDQELKDNGWLCLPANTDILFETPPEKRWEKALELSGINPSQLSALSGSA